MRTVSARTPMALGYLCEIENGHKEISSELLERLAFGLGTDVAEIAIQTGLKMAGVRIPDTITELLTELESANA